MNAITVPCRACASTPSSRSGESGARAPGGVATRNRRRRWRTTTPATRASTRAMPTSIRSCYRPPRVWPTASGERCRIGGKPWRHAWPPAAACSWSAMATPCAAWSCTWKASARRPWKAWKSRPACHWSTVSTTARDRAEGSGWNDPNAVMTWSTGPRELGPDVLVVGSTP